MPLPAGTKLGPYEIVAPMGAGGMGEVYRARDPRLGRDVAVKVSSNDFTERFEREARALSALNHPFHRQVDNFSGRPEWSRDGHELFFFSGQRMMAVNVTGNGSSFTATAPRELFSASVPIAYSNDSHRWQLSPDGNRFLLLVPSSGAASAHLDVVVNWDVLLKH